MSFPFDASKTQPGINPAVPGTGTPGFTAGTMGANDAGKMLSPGFSLPSMQNQAKPVGIFSSSLAGTPAPAFGSQVAPNTSVQQATSLNLGASTPGIPGTGLTFGATPTAAPSGLNFGMGGGAAASPAFGATSFSGSGLAGTTTVTSTPGGLSFGIPKPAASTATTGFSLGGTVAPPAAASTAPKLPFGGTGAAATPSTAFSLGGGLTTTPVAPAASIATTGTAFGITAAALTTPQTGISLGAPTSSTGFSLAPTTGATSFATGFGIGQTPAVTAATTAPSGFSLGGATTAATSTAFNLAGSAAPAISGGFTLNKTSTTQAAPTAVTTNVQPQTSLGTVTTVSSATTGQAGTMNFCQLEESINKWTLELEEQEKAFVNQATQVNAWDKLLIANGEKIATLNQEVERVKLEQQQLEHELDYVVGQQKELQDCLVPLEKELASLSVADPERDYTYRLAENLDKQLKQMSQDLKEIIEHLNEANRSRDSSDPIVQIGKILNAHMNSLQWLDQRTSVLGQKIQQIDQMHQNFRQENERSFNLAYN